MTRRFRKKHLERALALRRIERLFEVARKRGRDAPSKPYAVRAARLGRRLAMRYQTGLPKDLRDRYCRGCSSSLVPGQNARVRVHGGMVRTTCLDCDKTTRRPFLREQKQRRRAREGAITRTEEPVILEAQT